MECSTTEKDLKVIVLNSVTLFPPKKVNSMLGYTEMTVIYKIQKLIFLPYSALIKLNSCIIWGTTLQERPRKLEIVQRKEK